MDHRDETPRGRKPPGWAPGYPAIPVDYVCHDFNPRSPTTAYTPTPIRPRRYAEARGPATATHWTKATTSCLLLEPTSTMTWHPEIPDPFNKKLNGSGIFTRTYSNYPKFLKFLLAEFWDPEFQVPIEQTDKNSCDSCNSSICKRTDAKYGTFMITSRNLRPVFDKMNATPNPRPPIKF